MIRSYSKKTTNLSFVFLLLICHPSFSQYITNANDPKYREITALMWSDSDEEFEQTEVPAKWQNEDAVVLAENNYKSYKKKVLVAELKEENFWHRRIKLQSQKAIEDYTQFSFPSNSSPYGGSRIYYVGFKIIKPNGSETIVDPKDAVFEERGSSKRGFFKLAIPNLEIGDIVDYFLCSEVDHYAQGYRSFSPSIFPLGGRYPIVSGKIVFKVLRRCFITMKTYNDAPEIRKGEDDKQDQTVYTVTYEDMDKISPQPWFYLYRSVPTIKFKVSYASAMAAAPPDIRSSRPEIPKTQASATEVRHVVNYYLNAISSSTKLNRYMKKYKKEADWKKIVNEAFLFERNALGVSLAELKALNESSYEMSSLTAVANLSDYFQKRKIPHDIIVGVPKSIATLDDLILIEEIRFGLRVNTNPPIFLGAFHDHALPDEINPMLEDTRVYTGQVSSYGLGAFIPERLVSNGINLSTERISVDLNGIANSKKDLTLFHARSLDGHYKKSIQDLLVDPYDFIREEIKLYDFDTVSNVYMKKMVGEKEKFMANRADNRLKHLNELLEEQLRFSYDSVHTFQLNSIGRTLSAPTLDYHFKTISNDLLTKAGRNYLFNLGQLQSKQVEITKEEKVQRKFPVFMSYQRNEQLSFEIDLPSDMAIDGIDKIERKIENSVGAFEVTYTLNNQRLIVNSTLRFNKSEYSKDLWNEIMEIYDAVESFASVKLLIKPNPQ